MYGDRNKTAVTNSNSQLAKQIWVSIVFLDPRANSELVPRFRVALHALLVALPMVASKVIPNLALSLLLKISVLRILEKQIPSVFG
jgi:hypothetical protein